MLPPLVVSPSAAPPCHPPAASPWLPPAPQQSLLLSRPPPPQGVTENFAYKFDVATFCFTALTGVVMLAYTSSVVWQHWKLTRRFTWTTLLLLQLCASYSFVIMAFELVRLLQPHYDGIAGRMDTPLITVWKSALCVSAVLNISFMWLEFHLASERLFKLQSNIYIMRRFYIGFLIFGVILAAAGGILELLGWSVGLLLLSADGVFVTILIIGSAEAGARRLRIVYQRHAKSLQSEFEIQQQMQGQTQEASLSASQNLQTSTPGARTIEVPIRSRRVQLQQFLVRARLVVWSAHLVSAGALLHQVGSFLSFAGLEAQDHVVFAVGYAVWEIGIFFMVVTTARFVNKTLQASRQESNSSEKTLVNTLDAEQVAASSFEPNTSPESFAPSFESSTVAAVHRPGSSRLPVGSFLATADRAKRVAVSV